VNRRAIIILGAIFLVIVGTLVTLIVLRYRSTSTTTTTTTTSTTTTGSTTPDITPTPTPDPATNPVTPATRASRLTDEAVISPALLLNGSGVTYFNAQGQSYQTDLQLSGQTVLLSNKREIILPAQPGLSRIFWPATGNNYMAQVNGKLLLYDASKGEYVPLPPQVKSFDWTSAGDKIYFVWVDDKNKATLNVSNPDTTDYKVLTDLYEPDNVIYVAPDNSGILFHRTQTTDATNKIVYVTSDGKSFKTIVDSGYNFGVKWSPDSKKFVFGKKDAGGKFMLWLANIATGEIRGLNVQAGVDQVVWTKDSNFVVVAGTAAGATGQSVFKIALSGDKQEFAPGIAIDATDLFLNSTEDVLLFKNKADSALYAVTLTP
jgi:hypothetical protein